MSIAPIDHLKSSMHALKFRCCR